MSFEYAEAGCTKEELEKYRDQEGFIDLDKLNVNFPAESRERMGNPNRDKNWIDFNGKKALYKEAVKLDDEENSSIYAELIIEELAKQADIKTAHCDLVKLNGKPGILSYSVINEDEELHSLNSFIGETKDSEEYFDTVDLVDMLKKTVEYLGNEGLSKEETRKIIVDMQKLLAFDTFIMATDRHTENISFVRDVQGNISLAPIYDNENSLMLDMNNSLLDDLAKSPQGIKVSCDFIDPKIAIIPDEGEESKLLWKDTLNELCGNDDVYDFMMDCYDNLDIEVAIENVEERIGAELPDRVKIVATNAFNFRKKEIDKVMCMEYDDVDYGDIE